MTCEEPPTGLIPWFSKTEGNTYATLLHHPFLFKGKPTQCSRGSKDRQIVRRSKAFTVIRGQLFRESATGVSQKCITPEEGRVILNDIHSGTCGHHASSWAIVAKAYRAGFYWPRANEMAKEIVDKCEGCQFYSNMISYWIDTLVLKN